MDPIRGSSRMPYGPSNLTGYNYDQALQRLLHRNMVFDNIHNNLWYEKYNRFGWINILDFEQPCREYIFMTKPDLYICNGQEYGSQLTTAMRESDFFVELKARQPRILNELQYYLNCPDGKKDPFMHLIPNHIISKMDLPNISAETIKSTVNNYGFGIDYRGHTFKSDVGYDFALSVKDTPTLDIYHFLKGYDEYIRKLRIGEIIFHEAGDADTATKNRYSENEKYSIKHYQDYIFNHVIPEQITIYKFIIGSDGETILYWAKATGVSFMDVPRGEFSDPPQDGFKYSMSMHAFVIEDMKPIILKDFNDTSVASTNPNDFMGVYNGIDGGINNEPARYARIVQVANDNRTLRRNVAYDYRLKWTNIRKN